MHKRYIELAHEVVRTGTGWKRVGIRLRVHNDYPLLDSSEHPSETVGCGRLLLETDEHAPQGELACVCGQVIRGNPETLASYATEFGSFWRDSRNGLADVRAITPRYRGTCEVFGSVLLTPIKGPDGRHIGLLHVAAKEEGALDIQSVRRVEEVAAHLGRFFDALQVSGANDGRRPRTMLVVDDEPTMCRIAECLLSRVADQVLVATSGQEAMQILEQHRVDLVLTDLQMPDGNGDQLIMDMRARWGHYAPCAVLMSGAQAFEDVCEGLGVVGLKKPFRFDELLQAVALAT